MFVSCLVFVRLVLIVIVKQLWLDNNRKAPVLEKIRYFLLNLGATPVTSPPSLKEARSFTELGEKFRRQFQEMLVLLLLQLVENIFLAVPVLLSHLKIFARHMILFRSVGVLSIETESLGNSKALVLATLFTIPIGFCLQCAFFWLYTQYGHIWAAAVREERAGQVRIILISLCFQPPFAG